MKCGCENTPLTNNSLKRNGDVDELTYTRVWLAEE